MAESTKSSSQSSSLQTQPDNHLRKTAGLEGRKNRDPSSWHAYSKTHNRDCIQAMTSWTHRTSDVGVPCMLPGMHWRGQSRASVLLKARVEMHARSRAVRSGAAAIKLAFKCIYDRSGPMTAMQAGGHRICLHSLHMQTRTHRQSKSLLRGVEDETCKSNDVPAS